MDKTNRELIDEAKAFANSSESDRVSSNLVWELAVRLEANEWQPMETAPKKGEFLALLSNGWRAILQHPGEERQHYEWYRTASNLSIPVEDTFEKDYDWSKYHTIRATHWKPL